MKYFWQLLPAFLLLGLALIFPVRVLDAKQDIPKVEVVERKWPQEFKGEKGKLVVYAPQITSWDFQQIGAWFAVAFARSEKETPTLGSFKMTAETEVDHETRLVKMKNLQVVEIRFPDLTEKQTEKARSKLLDIFPREEFFVSLDRVISALERSTVRTNEVPINNDPPKILVHFRPAILVMLDGSPIWSPIKDSDLRWAVNTNWPLFSHEASGKYYLLSEGAWLEAVDLKGTWSPAFQLPDSFKSLPGDDKNWEDIRKNIPGKKLKPEELPKVFYVEEPAELILIAGEAKLEFIGDLSLQWVTNTESDLFFYPLEKRFYFLVSGRWFRTKDLRSSWEFATPELPEDFRQIPEDHPRADVRASVPGTREADDAVILASIPQRAQVDRTGTKAEVSYAGEPVFKPIEGTSMSYAVNTAESVIRVGDMYYLCYQAVWFASASPNGPWQVTDSIPKEIYTIPTNSPVHNVTYVHVYESTPTYVSVGYTSGYYGAYYYGGCVVYGTGYYYYPYYYWPAGYYYPYYYGWPSTYGVAAWYNPYTGTYGRGARYYGPYGGAGYGARYNARTGAYVRGGYAYGPYGAGGWAEAYNPRTNTYARTRQGSNYYSNWGSSYVRRGDDWARSGHASGNEAGAWGYKTSAGNQGFVGKNGDDLYAGRNGNVYRKTDNGWQQWNKGNWNTVDRPDTRQRDRSGSARPSTYENLNRDAAARNRGTRNTQGYGNWQRSGGTRQRSYRGGGIRRR